MGKKCVVAALFLLVFGALFGEVRKNDLLWSGRKTVWADSVPCPILSLDGAVYLNRVPYVLTKVPKNNSVTKTFEIQNVTFEPLSADDQKLLQESGCRPDGRISLVVQENSEEYVVRFLPVVERDGGWQKVVSYELRTDERPVTKLTRALAAQTYASSSAMSQGVWVKMRVPQSGIYKLTYEDIVSAGINPADLHIFGYGGALIDEDFSLPKNDDLPEVSYFANKGPDGVFGAGDYVLFYAQGPVSWTYNAALSEYERTRNPYSDYGYYFLASGTGGAPKEISLGGKVAPDGDFTLYTSFTDHFLHETDLVNLTQSGREFYGEELSGNSLQKRVTFSVPNMLQGRKFSVRFDGASFVKMQGGNPSSLTVNVNGVRNVVNLPTISPSDNYRRASEVRNAFSGTGSSSSVSVDISLNKSISTAKAWINFVALTAERALSMSGDQMAFRVPAFTSGFGKFSVGAMQGHFQIWDISSPETPVSVPLDFAGGTATFAAEATGSAPEFLALNPNGNFSKPEILEKVGNQNIHAVSNPELTIITNAEFLDASLRLAQEHRDRDNMSVLVVTAEQVYNEFSSGTPDASAYRRLMKMFYDRHKLGLDRTQPKYLLLMGNGTFDNRQILPSPDGSNKLLTYQSEASCSDTESYVVDDYFGFLDDSGGGDAFISTATLDIGVGRIPANTKAVADGVVEKLIRYMDNKSVGKWKNQLLFVADDGNDGLHVRQADGVASRAVSAYPDFQVTKLYLDAFRQQTVSGGESYPEAKEKLWKMLNGGVFFVDYVGHAGRDGLTNEEIVTRDELAAMRNENLAFWMTAACNFTRFDGPQFSPGEHLLLNADGGACGHITTTRYVFSEPNNDMNKQVINQLLKRDETGKTLRLGDLLKNAKRNCTSTMYNNKLNFFLFGDPAMRLSAAEYDVETESVNGLAADEVSVGALDKMTIAGRVANNGETLSDFNGVIYVTVYDKEIDVTTRNNDGNGSPSGIYVYKDRVELFSGKTVVENGRFTLQMMLPKDIDYDFGNAKINYYAVDSENNYEANGHEFFTLGGFSENADFADEEGPDVRMCLNTTDFVSGDRVAPNALLVVYINDKNGINLSSAGIGHEMVMKIDDGEWIPVSDYYEADFGSYQSGSVRYTLPDLPNGTHTLTFRVWDLLNNSTTQTVSFTVSENAAVSIGDFYCYPNPARDHVTFVFRHDRPDENLSVSLGVFDMTGRKLWSFDGDVQSEFSVNGNQTTIAVWDLTAPSGTPLQSGVYLYRFEVKGETGKTASKTKKLIIAK